MDSENGDQKQDTSSGNGTMLEQDSGQYENVSMAKSDSGVAGEPSPRTPPSQETDVDTGAPVEQEEEVIERSEVTDTVQSPVHEYFYSVPSEPRQSDQSYQSIDSELFYSLPEKSPISFSGDRTEEVVYEELPDQPDGDDKSDGGDEDDDDNIGSVSDEESFEDVPSKLKKSADSDDLMQGYRDDGSSDVSDIFTDVSAALQRLNHTYENVTSKPSDQHASRFDSLRSKYTRPRTYPPVREPVYAKPMTRDTGYQQLLSSRDHHPYTTYQTSLPVSFRQQPTYATDRDDLYPDEEDSKRLEDSVLKEVDDYTIRGEDSNPSKIPARIREIITKNLSPDDIDIPSNRMSTPNTGQLTEENRILAAELNRVEDLLAASRAERDELGIKYNALSDKLEQNLKGEGDYGETPSKNLVQQNIELRRKLEEEHQSYKRKLQAYQDGQQRQAQLVQKLQAKVLQYKKKCEEIEVDNSDIKSRYDHLKSLQSQQDSYHKGLDSESRLRQEAENNMDHESALIKLEEEQQRSASLAHVNSMLREQLDQATAANQSLTNDIHKLTNDWQRAREELEGKEAEWREEEQSFNEYFSNEHGRLLSLWREVVAFRRSFGELKTATERDMSHLRSDVTKASRSMHSACLNLSANQRSSDTQLSVLLDREKQERMSLENQLRDKNREIGELQSRYDTHSAELNSKVNELTMLNEKLKIQAEEHNKTISNLQRNINNLETRLGEQRSYDLPETESSRQYREETDVIHEALRNIAEAVINDADELDAEGGRRSVSPSRNRSMSPTARARSPILRNRSKSPMARSRSPAFADATFSAVQAALNKRQLQVSELRAKLIASKDHNGQMRKNLDDVENERRRLEMQIINLKEDLDLSKRDKDDTSRERDRLRNSLNLTGNEKSQLEKVRYEMNEQVEGLQMENEKLQAANTELQRQRDNIEEDKEDVTKDKERQLKENDRCHRVIDQLEHKVSSIKEELVGTKEALNRALLDKEVLEQQKAEVSDALTKSEVQKSDLELEINRAKTEEAGLRDALHKMQQLNEGLGQDKIELNKMIIMLENEKASLQGEKSMLEQERCGIREELVRVEQEKMDLDTEKMGLNQTLELSEMTRQQLEEEITAIHREKGETTEQLNCVARHKQALAEELVSVRKEMERVNTNLKRIAIEKERLTQEKGELIVQVTDTERENRHQSEVISSLKADKDSLESALYEVQEQARQLEVRKEQLEGENQELIIRKENLQSEINRLCKEKDADNEKFDFQREDLNRRLAQLERDMQMAITQEKQAHEDDVDRLSRERDNQRAEFESQREEMITQYNMEKEESNNKFDRMREELMEELAALQRDRDNSLMMAENDKQQTMSLLEQEKSTLGEKNNNLTMDLANANVEYERLKRDYYAKQEQDRTTINGLGSELKNFRSQFDETCMNHEKECKDLTNNIRELERQREGALREVAELKTQLKLVEENRDNIRRDLIEANRKIREGEETRDLMRKDIVELKRNINDEVREKDTISKTADELRNTVKRKEADKIELNRTLQDNKQRCAVLDEQKANVQKEAGDLRASLREVEKARLEARRELQELRRQVKQLDGERNKLGKEVGDLQNRVARDEEKEEESRRTSFDLKQKVVETEASREALRKELANTQRKMGEVIEESRMKEKDYQMALEDSRRIERKMEDQRRNLEIQLENTGAENEELKLRLSGAEGRVNALEATLARLEGAKRDIEFKLSSIVSSLRRTIGFRQEMPRARSPVRSRSTSPRRSRPNSPAKGFENTYATTTEGRGSPIPRTGSPDRAGSPIRVSSRGVSPSRFEMAAVDVDPEAVRMALRDFVQQLANAERERDDALANTKSMGIQLQELEDEKGRVERRLEQLQKSLGDVEEDKRGIDGRLASAQTALMLQEETIRRNERERKIMQDKMNALERSLTSAETEKRQQLEKISKMKANEGRLDDDKRNLRQGLEDAENRCTKLELARRSLEGDLQRFKLLMNDKETENLVLTDRVETLNKQIQNLDSKAQSLQLTVDRLSLTLAKTEEDGIQQKDKVQSLNMSLSDNNAALNELQERIQQLQRALTSSEHDRRVLQERLDSTRQALNDAKKQNYDLLERVQTLQNDCSESEVRRAEVEGQLRQNHGVLVKRTETEQELNQIVQKLTQDKQNMQDHISNISRNLSTVETQKTEMERTYIRLEKDKSALRKTLDKVEREKLKTEEIANTSLMEKGSLDRSLARLDEDNCDLNKQVQQLQAQLAEAEQQHAQRLIDVTTRHRAETEMETERLRTAQMQAERMLETRERSNRTKIKGLEETVATLKDQLSTEMKKRQLYISRSARTGDEIRDIRSILDSSLSNVTRDQSLDPLIMETETRKLDESLEFRGSYRSQPRRRTSPNRTPMKYSDRLTSTPAMRRTQSPIALRKKLLK
ncbi:uncharacterized protein LOC143057256 isoform X1 [Mytilus galloprovincialis]|uniref:uncharacterized protein LOC143057256 isoform X1 n=2 Tax=Mytilus galloprovincialis TaxID=29158 RepID=UPI003F7C06D2